MQKDFSKQLIKGKIAELVFDQMFRTVGDYTVIPFGYETIIPELLQYTDRADSKDLIGNMRSAPDFALVHHQPKQVLLVEVKYRSQVNMEEIRGIASSISEKWKLVWLFLATPTGFFFDSCIDLAGGNKLTFLGSDMVPTDIQDEYQALLNSFVQK